MNILLLSDYRQESNSEGSRNLARTRKRHSIRTLVVIFFIVTAPLYGWAPIPDGILGQLQFDHISTLMIIGFGFGVMYRQRIVHLESGMVLGVLFLIVTTLSVTLGQLYRPDTISSIFTVYVQFLMLIGALVIIPNFRLSLQQLNYVVRVWVLVAVALSVFGAYQAVARVYSLPFARLVFNYAGETTLQRIGYDYAPYLRVGSLFAEPSWFGTFLVPPTVFLLTSHVIATKPSVRPVFSSSFRRLALSVMLLFGVFLSASLLAYLTLGVTVCLIILPLSYHYNYIKPRHLLSTVIVLGTGYIVSDTFRLLVAQFVLIPLNVLYAVLSGNIAEIATIGSTMYRLRNVLFTVEMWAEGTLLQLLLGRGPNTLARIPNSPWEFSTGAYFQILVDQGILGLTLFVGFITIVTIHLISLLGRQDQYIVLAGGLNAAVFATGFMFLQIGAVRPARWIPLYLACALLVNQQIGRGKP